MPVGLAPPVCITVHSVSLRRTRPSFLPASQPAGHKSCMARSLVCSSCFATVMYFVVQWSPVGFSRILVLLPRGLGVDLTPGYRALGDSPIFLCILSCSFSTLLSCVCSTLSTTKLCWRYANNGIIGVIQCDSCQHNRLEWPISWLPGCGWRLYYRERHWIHD